MLNIRYPDGRIDYRVRDKFNEIKKIFLFSEDKIEHLIQSKGKLMEITGEQRYVTRPTLNEILTRKDKKSNNQAKYEAHLQYGYTLKEIAEYLGVHYSTVSRAIKRIEQEDEK